MVVFVCFFQSIIVWLAPPLNTNNCLYFHSWPPAYWTARISNFTWFKCPLLDSGLVRFNTAVRCAIPSPNEFPCKSQFWTNVSKIWNTGLQTQWREFVLCRTNQTFTNACNQSWTHNSESYFYTDLSQDIFSNTHEYEWICSCKLLKFWEDLRFLWTDKYLLCSSSHTQQPVVIKCSIL